MFIRKVYNDGCSSMVECTVVVRETRVRFSPSVLKKMVNSFKLLKKQILILFVFSFLVSIASIVHGIFFDLQFEQIKRLTLEGLIFTLIVIFPAVIFLEWIFDINNKKNYDELNQRLIKLEKKHK